LWINYDQSQAAIGHWIVSLLIRKSDEPHINGKQQSVCFSLLIESVSWTLCPKDGN
jgi:hypothetical protein